MIIITTVVVAISALLLKQVNIVTFFFYIKEFKLQKFLVGLVQIFFSITLIEILLKKLS